MPGCQDFPLSGLHLRGSSRRSHTTLQETLLLLIALLLLLILFILLLTYGRQRRDIGSSTPDKIYVYRFSLSAWFLDLSWGLLGLPWGLLELSWGSLGSSKVLPKVSQAGTLGFDEFLKKEVQIRRTVALGSTLGVNSLGKVEGKVTVYRPA